MVEPAQVPLHLIDGLALSLFFIVDPLRHMGVPLAAQPAGTSVKVGEHHVIEHDRGQARPAAIEPIARPPARGPSAAGPP